MAGVGMSYPTKQAGQHGHGNYQHGREGRVGVAARHEAGRGGGGWAGAWGAGRARSSAEVVAPAGGAASRVGQGGMGKGGRLADRGPCPAPCSGPAAPTPLPWTCAWPAGSWARAVLTGQGRLGLSSPAGRGRSRSGGRCCWRFRMRVPQNRPPTVNRNMSELPRGILSKPSGDQEISKISNFSRGVPSYSQKYVLIIP